MKCRTLAITGGLLVLASVLRSQTTPQTPVANQNQEEAAIRKVEADLQQASNRHDAKAWANLCTEDVDVVNVVGWWWRGRPQIEKKVAELNTYLFRVSTLTNEEIHIRFLTSDVAIVHVRWSMVGGRNPDGTPGQPQKGLETQVLHKLAGKWLIAAFHNADSVPEVPFPP